MFLLEPVYKDYLWGGTALRERYGKGKGLPLVAESWELSTHPDGLTRLAGTGETLREAVGEDLPILVKLIDAHKPLSVQVHPDDAYAARTAGERGKTELWYVVAAEKDAYLYLGLKRPATKEELEAAIRENRVEELLNKVPVHAGESWYIPAGTLHAIGPGCLIYEVQESSNLTYRVYDYGRLDAQGRPRALHIADALAVATLAPVSTTPPGAEEGPRQGPVHSRTVVRCPYFSLWELRLDGESHLAAPREGFLHLLCLEGRCTLCQGKERLTLAAGGGAFLRSGEAAALAGKAVLLAVAPGQGGEAQEFSPMLR